MGIVWLTLTCIVFLTLCYLIAVVFISLFPRGAIYWFFYGVYAKICFTLWIFRYYGPNALKYRHFDIKAHIDILRGYNKPVRYISAIAIKKHIKLLKTYKLWKPF